MASTATPASALTSAAFSAMAGDMSSRNSLTLAPTAHPATYTSF